MRITKRLNIQETFYVHFQIYVKIFLKKVIIIQTQNCLFKKFYIPYPYFVNKYKKTTNRCHKN